MTWITVLGQQQPALAEKCNEVSDRMMSAGIFRASDVAYLQAHSLPILNGTMAARGRSLELLRQLATYWDVQIATPTISSHRKVIGPAIVFCKKIAFRIISILLKEQVQRQRDFNAKTVELMIALHSELTSEGDHERV
jgi:hypothetical protein